MHTTRSLLALAATTAVLTGYGATTQVTPVAATVPVSSPPPAAPAAPAPLLAEDFSGPAGTLPADLVRVGKEAGGYGVEKFSDDPDLVGLDGEGHLRVSALRNGNGSWRGGITRTAAGVTLDRPTTIEVRAKLPSAAGGFPAIWLINSLTGGSWAEIDLAELFPGGGWQGGGAYFTVHDWSVSPQQGDNLTPSKPAADGDWHTWRLETTGEPAPSLTLFIDGVKQGTISRNGPGRSPATSRWVYDDKPMHLVFNEAVSGSWPGAQRPDKGTTRLDLLIDSVSITQQAS